MNSNGSGVTFSEHDLVMAKRIIGLMNQVKYTLDPLQIVQGAEAIMWFQRDLLKSIEENIMEVKKVINTKKETSGDNE
jgi:hypothetical protein